MSAPLSLRPHHILCALGFEGHGYSDAFTANMEAIVIGQLRTEAGDETVIQITGGADAICAPCPRRRGAGCEAQTEIDTLDRAHGEALHIAPGDRLTWKAAQDRVRENVRPDDLDIICAGCRWLSLGLCKAAVARLHD
ncbi:DUF1284 domain-containing protein [Gymnodinialimonas ceratoperidinii]|uniref:DUF1284 domain-containing protein n=1 Tax=Gymnodinialimonas ceratoperidinii TaxID=2856823 RepID=A0A8F6Y9R8_9RHOB|nr:DUF1284 domain-containing protein [Gymnodinialimonas ceratoperidinii]QXT38828.1 DUF1284 domain-containing protein [Gymnodinialimonas ceratoperidinii]